MKVKLFTHTDLDGIGCVILAKLAFEDVDVEYCNYNDVNQKVEKFYIASSKNHYDKAFITDISVSESVAKIIEYYSDDKFYPEIKLLDHHKTALWLNEYDWATVETHMTEDMKESGTSLFLDYIKEILWEQGKRQVSIQNFVKIVRLYDSWEWKEQNDDIPKKWNDLFKILGRDRFIKKIISIILQNDGIYFSETDELLLELEQDKIDKYVKKKNEYIIKKEILGYKAGIVFADRYISELGNRLSELNPNLDFIAMINPDYAVSYRTIKNDVDVSEIAKHFGGGGHPKASRSPVSGDLEIDYIDKLFKTN